MIYTETVEAYRINHNLGRLDIEKNKKVVDARKKFHMDDTKPGPRLFPEVLDAMKNGKMTFKELPDDYKNARAIDSNGRLIDWGFLRYVDFVDPSAPKPDEAGFKKAMEGLDTAYTAAKDVIMIDSDPAKGLAAVQKFAS